MLLSIHYQYSQRDIISNINSSIMPRINWKNSPFAELEKKLNQRSNILRRNVGKLTAEEIDKYFPKGICGFEGCETKLSNLSCLKRHIEMKHTALYQQLT